MNVRFTTNKKELKLPDSSMSFSEVMAYQNSLHVPETAPASPSSFDFYHGFIDENHFRCYDGTILDFRTGKIVKQNSSKNGECGSRVISIGSSPSWNDDSNDMIRYNNGWKKMSEQENKKCLDNLTDEQKEMLRQLELGLLVGKSKLELDD